MKYKLSIGFDFSSIKIDIRPEDRLQFTRENSFWRDISTVKDKNLSTRDKLKNMI